MESELLTSEDGCKNTTPYIVRSEIKYRSIYVYIQISHPWPTYFYSIYKNEDVEIIVFFPVLRIFYAQMYAVEQYEVYCGRGSSHEKKSTSLSVTDGRTDEHEKHVLSNVAAPSQARIAGKTSGRSLLG